MAQEQRLVAINRNLENEILERKFSEEKIKDLNRQLLENISRLETANQELDRFAFMASHDLQEPMRKIRLFSDRLHHKYKELLDPEAIMFINRIQLAGIRMENLIKDILTFSKISVEKDPFIETDLNRIINEVLEEMNDEMSEKAADVKVDILPHIMANPGLMRPLFFNLLSNSLKYSRKNVPPKISIRFELTNETISRNTKKEYCRIFIEDNGIGFDQIYAEQIFGMFKRLHRQSEFEGTGIGLALCKKIVEEHHGHITALSKVNEGSTFIVSLPLHNGKQLIN
jgi:light-regulated signal transduction histidine kinase (bacteriophytochrome)